MSKRKKFGWNPKKIRQRAAMKLLRIIESGGEIPEKMELGIHNAAVEARKKFKMRGPLGGFYQTREWKELRYAALEKHGGRCHACGACSADGVRMNVDHIEPISKAWHRRLDPTNVQILCARCNTGKSNKFSTDWRPKIVA